MVNLTVNRQEATFAGVIACAKGSNVWQRNSRSRRGGAESFLDRIHWIDGLLGKTVISAAAAKVIKM
jgi:hypothetical protein